MILIDAVFIHNGGGKILLDYLISHLDFDAFEYVFLLDKRLDPYPITSSVELHYANGFSERKRFYSKHRTRFEKVFCLGNIPPHYKMEAFFINYLHSSYYVSKIDKTYLKHYFVTMLKKIVFKYYIKNVDLWIVQTPTMKKRLEKLAKVRNIEILPFFKTFGHAENMVKKKNTFLYVSNGSPHKNHVRLINAFCKFYDQFKLGELLLTVSDYCEDICTLINKKVEEGYPILNYGFIEREKLKTVYQFSEFVVFPSLTESFGLGLIEACDFNCKILASDLDYVYDVCKPSFVFDPYNEDEIYWAFEFAVTEKLNNPVLKCRSHLEELVEIIQDQEKYKNLCD